MVEFGRSSLLQLEEQRMFPMHGRRSKKQVGYLCENYVRIFRYNSTSASYSKPNNTRCSKLDVHRLI